MFRLDILRDRGASGFNRQLPFFNWYYPFATDGNHNPDRLEPLSAITPSGGRRAAYVHIPFCDTVCSFCPFSRGAYRAESEVEEYLSALICELTLKERFIGRYAPTAIFVGGGTPSVLSPAQIERLGAAMRDSFDLRQLEELTFELEVKSVSRDKLRAMRAMGVNRVSFGVQTFSSRHRQIFSLDATISQIREVAEWATEEFPYTNVDMIYGAAGQSIDELCRDVDAAVGLGTTTIDFYPLNNLAAQVRMHRAAAAATLEILPAKTRLRYRMVIDERMQSRGYRRISGYGYATARPASPPAVVQQSPKFLYHDIVYGYHDDQVVGYGAAALTQVPGAKLHNFADRREYVEEVRTGRLPHDAFRVGPCYEKGVVSFPYRGVLDKGKVCWKDVPAETAEALARAREAGFIEDAGDTLQLTDRGWFYYVNLMYYLMPSDGKLWISDRIVSLENDGHSCEDTDLTGWSPALG